MVNNAYKKHVADLLTNKICTEISAKLFTCFKDNNANIIYMIREKYAFYICPMLFHSKLIVVAMLLQLLVVSTMGLVFQTQINTYCMCILVN